MFLPVRALKLSFASGRDDYCGSVWKDPGLMIVGGLINRILRAPVEEVVNICEHHSVYRSGSFHSRKLWKNVLLCKDARS